MDEETKAAIKKMLNYKLATFQHRYDSLTADEKSKMPKHEFDLVVAWLQAPEEE